jgi:hypothetical protein
MGGVYCEDVDIAEAVPADFPEPRGVRPWVMDRNLVERPWTKSAEWTDATLHCVTRRGEPCIWSPRFNRGPAHTPPLRFP